VNEFKKTLEERIQALLDGTISETEFHHLENELTDSPEARRTYYEYTSLHQSLDFRLRRKSPESQASNLGEIRLKHQRSKTIKFTITAAAALIICSLIVLQVLSIRQNAVEATALKFETSPGSKFTITHQDESTEQNASTLPINSRLQVSQGTVELEFASGVNAIIQAPADVVLTSRNSLKMDNGVGWFEVPAEAIGFKVTTREMEIIDLGTEFGVVSDPLTKDQIHVFKGKVQAKARYGVNEKITLTKNQAAKLYPSGRFELNPVNPPLFLKELPTTLPHQHWSFDNSENLISGNTITAEEELTYTIHPSDTPPPLIPGKFGNALNLDGKTNFLETNWPGILGNAPRTVAFWLKMPERRSPETLPRDLEHHTIIGWGTQHDFINNNNLNNKWTIHFDLIENRYPMLNISFGGMWHYAPDTILDDNTWHHIAVTYSGTADDSGLPITTLYINGIQHPTQQHYNQPTHRNSADEIIIDTIPKTPLVIGASPSADTSESVKPEPLIQAQIDELFIIEGTINEASIRRLIQTNSLTH